MSDRIKSFLRAERTFFAAVVLLVGLGAYGLGLQTDDGAAVNSSSSPAIMFTAAPDTPLDPAAIPVVGSRGGTKYHRLDCPGALQMKNENKIFFDSIELARSAGYLPAGNCPGLE